jgi:hypothetical protein
MGTNKVPRVGRRSSMKCPSEMPYSESYQTSSTLVGSISGKAFRAIDQ